MVTFEMCPTRLINSGLWYLIALFSLMAGGPGRSSMEGPGRMALLLTLPPLGQSCWHANDLDELRMPQRPFRRAESALSTC